MLKKSKQYLKNQYQLNCNDTTPISSHNIAFSHSDSSDESFQMPSQVDQGEVCKDCNILLIAIEGVWNTVDDHSRDQDLKYDIKIATEAIFQYINHLMCDIQQKKAKEFAFSMVALWLKDFSQKLLGKHTIPCKVSIMDEAKESFIHRMKG